MSLFACSLIGTIASHGQCAQRHRPAPPAMHSAPTPIQDDSDASPYQEPAFGTLKTFSGVGKQAYILKAGHEVEILRHSGKGCLTHMWFAMDERVRVRIYVDGEQTPSIDMALDLGHGYGFGGVPEPAASPKMGRYGGQFNTFKIPYGNGVRVTLLPMASFPQGGSPKAWWIIHGVENLPVKIGGWRLPANARLRLYTREGYEAKPLEEFSLCDVKGRGFLYLVALSAMGLRKSGSWTDLSYMEGEMRGYFNGSTVATLLSSGLEDYFLGSGYFNQNQTYWGAVGGLTHLDKPNNAFSAYRFHDDDPIFFQSGFRLTCRNGEQINGNPVGDPPPTRYWTYAWLYQW